MYKRIDPKRIDQFLFVDIIRQSYEAQSAWVNWLEKYRVDSQAERDAYETFSKKMRNNIEPTQIIDLWYKLSDKERDDLIREEKVDRDRFKNVQHMMEMYSHTMM